MLEIVSAFLHLSSTSWTRSFSEVCSAHETFSAFDFFLGKPIYLRLWPTVVASRSATLVVGLKDFTAAEGHVVIPGWIGEMLKIAPSQDVLLSLEDEDDLPEAESCQLRALEVDFLKLPNPRAILETALSAQYRMITQVSLTSTWP